MNGPRRFRRAVAADAAGEGELLEELAHPVNVFALVRIDLGIGAFEIDRRQDAGRAVPGARQEYCIEVVLVDQAIEVDIGEAQSRTGAPMAQEANLDVFRLQRLTQQRVIAQIDHAGGQVIAGAPVGVHLAQLVGG